MHDINLVNILTVLDYYSDQEEGAARWRDVSPVDFNSSVRFEVYQTEPSAHDSLDNAPQTFVKILFDDAVIPCDPQTWAISCPLKPFLERISQKVLIDDTQL